MSNLLQMKDTQFLDDSIPIHRGNHSYANCVVDCHKAYDKACFLESLRVELQRVRRSKSPLSLVLISVRDNDKEGFGDIKKVFKLLRTIIRETDIPGYLDQSTIGVLLPYTDKHGTSKISEKIMSGSPAGVFSVTASTYPDQIFEGLATQGCVSSDILNLMAEDGLSISYFGLIIKRVVDIIGAITALLIFSPLIFLTALFVKLDSPGPIIFKQTRLGIKGIPFTFYKFRSMRTNSSDQIHRDYVLKLIDGDQSGINLGNQDKPLYKIKSDPRITSVGKFIRKTSIDELPQLYNVLKGDMSLVGPRPPLAYEVAKYQAWHLRRVLEMKPGMTGLWQVEGRSRTEFNDAVRLDVKYLQTWSLMLDIKIMLKTVIEVFRCRGAV